MCETRSGNVYLIHNNVEQRLKNDEFYVIYSGIIILTFFIHPPHSRNVAPTCSREMNPIRYIPGKKKENGIH